ncbi:50S ribosomal protein L18 [bacterium]|nr:50S ribosomal protein L18 [bacterium]
MATKLEKNRAARVRRKKHVRKHVNGTAERPRLVINRSLKYMGASLVDDDRGMTLFGTSTKVLKMDDYNLPKEPEAFKAGDKKLPLTGKVADAYRLGLAIAAMAKDKGIGSVVFDRNGLRYHGRVRAVAEGARKGGLVL